MHHLVQYGTAAPHQMHGVPVLVLVQETIIKCTMDRSKIDHRLLQLLETLATEEAAKLTLRDLPAATPWGHTSLPLVDTSHPGLMIPVVTPTGIVCPVPRHLIAADLARALEKLTDAILRLYNPPTL